MADTEPKKTRYIVKVQVSVYEDSDDLTDIFDVTLKSSTTLKNSALGFAEEIQTASQVELMKMQKD